MPARRQLLGSAPGFGPDRSLAKLFQPTPVKVSALILERLTERQ
jgi:hypothetical protein